MIRVRRGQRVIIRDEKERKRYLYIYRERMRERDRERERKNERQRDQAEKWARPSGEKRRGYTSLPSSSFAHRLTIQRTAAVVTMHEGFCSSRLSLLTRRFAVCRTMHYVIIIWFTRKLDSWPTDRRTKPKRYIKRYRSRRFAYVRVELNVLWPPFARMVKTVIICCCNVNRVDAFDVGWLSKRVTKIMYNNTSV